MSEIKAFVRGAYDIQKLRIQMGNRIVANLKAILGQEPGEKEEKLEERARNVLNDLRIKYKKITDGVVRMPTPKQFKGDEVISSYAELCLITQYLALEKDEERQFKHLGNILCAYPIWTEYLKGVQGVGPAMAGVIISEIDIAKSKYPSSVWKYAGLDVAADGAGRSKRSEHQIDVEYEDKNGDMKMKKSITFNPFLKTKLTGVLSASFLRCGKENVYAKVYYDYKNRMENHAKYGKSRDKVIGENGRPVTSKLRRHNMAIRYMIKIFLVDLYTNWRELEGLPVSKPYAEAKLGYTHGSHNQEIAAD